MICCSALNFLKVKNHYIYTLEVLNLFNTFLVLVLLHKQLTDNISLSFKFNNKNNLYSHTILWHSIYITVQQ